MARALPVAAILLAMYLPVLRNLAMEWWTNPAASQGMAIPPVALYVAWMRRRGTLAIPVETDWRGLLLVGLGCASFLAGTAAADFFLSRISLLFVIGGIGWCFWGLARLRTLQFPLLLLATMIPLPGVVIYVLTTPLQLFASLVATEVARLAGVDVFRDGNVIHLAEVQLGVAEACSGLHSVSALVVASLLLGFVESARLWVRIFLFVLAVPVAIAVNVARVSGTAILADYNPEFAMGFYHSFSGWLVFLLGFAALWALAKLLCMADKRRLS